MDGVATRGGRTMLAQAVGGALRFKVVVDRVSDLRERLNVEGRKGRLLWSATEALVPRDLSVAVEITVRDHGETIHLRGRLAEAEPGEPAGVYIDLPDAGDVLDGCTIGLCRNHRRLPTEHLALVHGDGIGQILCRVRDLGGGGARLLLAKGDVGPIGSEMKVALLEAGLQGADLELTARIAWTATAEIGLEWREPNDLARAALTRLLRTAAEPWQLAMVG